MARSKRTKKAEEPVDRTTVIKLKQHLMQRLRTGPAPVGLEKQEEQIRDFLSQTVTGNLSNSVLITGPHGTGKSATLNRVLQEFEKLNRKEKKFYTIRLDGLFQTDARSSLFAIQQQLKVEADLDSDLNLSFTDRLTTILATFASRSQNSVPIVFILEQMDLFALHPKQLLLYNLFDIVQSSKAPIAVIGLTNKIDTLLLLEKRVKSRFSHRMIDFEPLKSYNEFELIAKSLLLVNDPVLTKSNPGLVQKFNENIDMVFDNSEVVQSLTTLFDISNDVQVLLKMVSCLVSSISLENLLISADMILKFLEDYLTDARTGIIYELSTLEFGLLVAINKVLDRQEAEFNFEMCFEEYRNFARKAHTMGSTAGVLLTSKKVALKAFENLEQFGVFKFKDGVTSKCPKEYKMAYSLLTRTQINYGLARYDLPLPDALRKWATSH